MFRIIFYAYDFIARDSAPLWFLKDSYNENQWLNFIKKTFFG